MKRFIWSLEFATSRNQLNGIDENISENKTVTVKTFNNLNGNEFFVDYLLCTISDIPEILSNDGWK